jgi:periplasmic protein TonB
MTFLPLLVLSAAAMAQELAPAPAVLPAESGDLLCTDKAYKEQAYGSTTLLIDVDKKGKVHNPRVLKAFREDLDKAAVKSAKDWHFEPKKGEKLAPSTVQIDVTFDCREQIYRVNGDIRPPKLLPGNPEIGPARKAPPEKDFSGQTLLTIIVGTDGKVKSAKVLRSSGNKQVDEKVLKAVRDWQFSPAMKDGKPVAVMVNVAMNLNLH